MNESLVRLLLRECWESASRARHKSLVASFLIRDTFGGEIRTCGDDGTFCNRILDVDYCCSATSLSAGTHELLEWPELIERIPAVAAELVPMRERWRRTLSRRLPLPSISHIVIQDEEANPGSYACPDFSCVLLTADSAQRLNTDLFLPGQTFWLKGLAVRLSQGRPSIAGSWARDVIGRATTCCMLPRGTPSRDTEPFGRRSTSVRAARSCSYI